MYPCFCSSLFHIAWESSTFPPLLDPKSSTRYPHLNPNRRTPLNFFISSPMKPYQMNYQFLFNLVVYAFTSLACSLFFSYPHWCPSLWLSSLNHFLFTSVPNICSSFCNPNCFFLVGNTIVLFLIGEWKFLGSQSSPAAEIFDEYARIRTRASSALQEAKAMELEDNFLVENLGKVEEEREEKEEQEEKNSDEDGEEDEPGLPDEELNRRAEEFIARINKQRWLEARLLVYADNNTEDTHAILTD